MGVVSNSVSLVWGERGERYGDHGTDPLIGRLYCQHEVSKKLALIRDAP